MTPHALLVLGGWPYPDVHGVWRSSLFENGGMGDRLRVDAAALLYRARPQTIVIVGGKGKLASVADAPACAVIMKRELIELGIPAEDIVEEISSGNTYEQLQHIKALIAAGSISNLRVLSNRYHVPRIEAFLTTDEQLSAWLAGGHIEVQAAEEILVRHDPHLWQALIDQAYSTPTMRRRIERELQGVRDIQAGTYVPAAHL